MRECYNSCVELVIKPIMSDVDFCDYLKNDWEDTLVQEELFWDTAGFISSLSDSISSKFKRLQEEDGQVQVEFVSMFYDFIGKILNLLKDYLPLEDKLIEILDFIDLKDPLSAFKQKLKFFCEYFNILKEEEKATLQDELVSLKQIRIDYYQDSSLNTLHMWDRIQAKENLTIIPRMIKFAESLPTTSAGIEQSFSQIKLLKSDLRNRLHESTLEGLILISEEFKAKKAISIDERVLKLFIDTKKEFNRKKKVVITKKNPQKILDHNEIEITEGFGLLENDISN